MPQLIATISGHRAQQAAFLRTVQSRASDAAAPLPATTDSEGIPAELLGVDPPGMAAAAEVPAERIAAQEEAMQRGSILLETPLIRTVFVDPPVQD
jgi:hypothetical protein